MEVSRSLLNPDAAKNFGTIPPLDGKKESKADILSKLEAAYIDPREEYPKPPVCIEINGGIVGTLGNVSTAIGKAKSRKTFLITMALAASTKSGLIQEYIKGSLPESSNIVLLFDTEQGKYHVHRTVKRVCSLSGIEYPKNFRAYGLRKYPPNERLEMIEAKLYNTPNLGFVVIDGIKDLINSINDEAEATMITSKLLKWTEELNIHIMVVLHQNKGDTNARGHVGTELQNKSESVISITKDPGDKNLSIVEAEYCRDKDFEPFAFTIDGQGLPSIVSDWTMNRSETLKSSRCLPPMNIPDLTHVMILKDVYRTEKTPKLSEFDLSLKNALSSHYNGKDSGNTKPIKITVTNVKEYRQHYLDEGFIIKKGSSPHTKYLRNEGQ